MKKFLLAILSLGSAAFAHAQCSELFFSEIVEGSGNNKAIEIYNPTSSPIALNNYRIVRFSNGSSTGTDSLNLTGTIAAHDVWVVVNGQTVSQPSSPACDTALQALADQLSGAYPDPLYENGNDAIALVKIDTINMSPITISRTMVDIFGKIGEDPGTAWTDVFPYTSASGTWITKDHGMIRKSTVTMGVTTNPTAFNVMMEYDTLSNNDWSNLGIHNSTCNASGISESKNNASVSVFPNPSNGTFTLSAASAIKSTEIFNALGEVIYSSRFDAMKNEQLVNLSAQPAGLYFVRVEFSNGTTGLSRISIR